MSKPSDEDQARADFLASLDTMTDRMVRAVRLGPLPYEGSMSLMANTTHDDADDQLVADTDEQGEQHNPDWVQFYPRVPEDIRRSFLTLAAQEGIPSGALLTFEHLLLLQVLEQNPTMSGTLSAWYKQWRTQRAQQRQSRHDDDEA